MPHHFTKATIQAEIFCRKCGKMTPWRIADGRRNYCLTCYSKPVEHKELKSEKQPGLFDRT